MMESNEVNLRIQPIANGFLVSAFKAEDGYRTAHTPTTYVATRQEIVDGLPSLFGAAEALSFDDAKDDF